MQNILYFFRRIRTWLTVAGKSSYLLHGKDLHVGKGARLWAPKFLEIGDFVYIGKYVHIEANCRIGSFCLIANRVSIVGRHDHDYLEIGFPMRFAPWIASKRFPSKYIDEEAVIEDDVWLGYGSIILTGVRIGRGSIVAAGSVVTRDLPEYCIAAGVPAKVISWRFTDAETIRRHEESIRTGRFVFTEKGYDYCVIEPGLKKGSM